MMASLLSTSNG